MAQATTFDDVLEAVAQLSADEQETLLEVVQRRIAERRRTRLAVEISESREEFDDGRCVPATPDELLNEIAS